MNSFAKDVKKHEEIITKRWLNYLTVLFVMNLVAGIAMLIVKDSLSTGMEGVGEQLFFLFNSWLIIFFLVVLDVISFVSFAVYLHNKKS